MALDDLNSFGDGFVKALGGITPWDSACGVNASGTSRNELRSQKKKNACAREAGARESLRKEISDMVSTCSDRLDDFRHGEAFENYAQNDQNSCVCTIN